MLFMCLRTEDKHISISWLTLGFSRRNRSCIFFSDCPIEISGTHVSVILLCQLSPFFKWLWIRTVDCPLVYCIFSCAGIILNRCAIVLSNIAWKIGILHHCLVIVAFPCKLIFEISNMCLTNALLIGMLQEATYLWEDDDDRLVALVYDLMLASVQFNRWYCCSFQNLFDMDWWDTLDFTQTLRVNF